MLQLCANLPHFPAPTAGSRNTEEQGQDAIVCPKKPLSRVLVLTFPTSPETMVQVTGTTSHEDEWRWRWPSQSKHVGEVRQVLLERISSMLLNLSHDLFGSWQGCVSPKAKEVKCREKIQVSPLRGCQGEVVRRQHKTEQKLPRQHKPIFQKTAISGIVLFAQIWQISSSPHTPCRIHHTWVSGLSFPRQPCHPSSDHPLKQPHCNLWSLKTK